MQDEPTPPPAEPEAPELDASAEAPEAPEPRERAPKLRKARDPEKRRREAHAEAVRREVRKALASGDEEKLLELRGVAVGERKPKALAKPEAPAAQVLQLAPPPPPADSRGPNWPPNSAIEGWKPVVAPLVAVATAVSQGRSWQIPAQQVEVTVAGVTKVMSAQEALTDAVSALAAKYLPQDVNSPEAYLGAVCFAIWGGPVIAKLLTRAGESLGLAPAPAPLVATH